MKVGIAFIYGNFLVNLFCAGKTKLPTLGKTYSSECWQLQGDIGENRSLFLHSKFLLILLHQAVYRQVYHRFRNKNKHDQTKMTFIGIFLI